MKRIIDILFLLIGCISVSLSQSSTKLTFNKPATFFEESFAMGNGRIGATIFGNTKNDYIYLNDITLWTGEPVNANMNPEAYKNVPAIREALKNEDYALAEKLNRKLQGSYSQSYAPLGTLYMNFDLHGDVSDYYRELDVSKSIAYLTFLSGNVRFKREYFVSYPDKVVAIKLSADTKATISFHLFFDSKLKYSVDTKKNTLSAYGYSPYFCAPNYQSLEDAIKFEDGRGTRFATLCKVNNKGGTLTSNDSGIIVRNADQVILYISIATSFNGFDKDPSKQGLDEKLIARKQLNRIDKKSYSTIYKNHVSDYRGFFDRVELNLGNTTAPELPTDERLKRYATGAEDKSLEILYFNYGRYLLISSSRTNGVPANLQGLWNPYIRPPWSSNYTTNINVEENYWPVEICNLSELHNPLLLFIGNLAKTGAITAKTFYGCGGWALAHNSDIWAMTNPVGNFGEGDPMWACWNMGGAWISTHLWEHYLFTKDEKFLRQYAYPIMKGAAEFCQDWLVEDNKGDLITSPSTSPENQYISYDGFKGATLYGGTADLAMIRECFMQTIAASKILNLDADFRAKIERSLAKLHPYQVGKKGNLQEWYYDWEDVDPHHRHQSHLFGLYPGQHISPSITPDLANASRQTLEIKGDETTGWSKGWRINLWARLWDGNRAYKMLRELLSYVDPDGYKGADKKKGGGTYPNLFDAHPPFQIDGNFGGTAAIAEMLLQSTESEIRLLPALPSAWKEGSILGLKARGNYEVSIVWNDNRLYTAELKSISGGQTKILSKDPFSIDENIIAEKDNLGFYFVSVKSRAGKVFRLKAIR
jgi:alpha-L-fucosidase 2